ncbi:MAG: histidine--tRNA ligase [Oscillospiraceae bacterium]|nr:histidine--tRNA ligase [Oscillospiraceae bacterium]
MALSKKPVNGMKDIMPDEMRIRDYLIDLIKKTYKEFGFTSMETPVVESLANLTSKQGGDNEKLIFKILKRGEKLKIEEAKTDNDLADSGLRYDLTVPLVRYYSNHMNDLPKPFKALQIGPVFRADRPQRGRFRQFYQCDIDILGEPSNLAEIELILATTKLLSRIGFSGFTVVINDRRILKGMAAWCGFPEDSWDQVFIELDKMDKIGMDGVKNNLAESGFGAESIERLGRLFSELAEKEDQVGWLKELLSECMEEDAADSLSFIMKSVGELSSGFSLVFDPTLVRGMSYYTGTIFEIRIDGLNASCGGGGRYDRMVGKFTNIETPAVGFSIGFERIITILMEQGFKVPGEEEAVAFLVEKNMPAERMTQIMKEAQALREEGKRVLVSVMNKNRKFQKEQLMKEGYKEFRECYINNL